MKPLTRKILIIVVVIILAIAVIVPVVWTVTTTQGTRWLLTTAIPLSGASFSAQKIEGCIGNQLLLTGIRVGLAQQKIEIDSLELRWKPLLLLSGSVAVQDLIINGARIQDDAPPDNKPPNLAWPRVSETGQLFDGRITRLQVTNLSYRNLQEQPLLITVIVGSLTWQECILSIKDLTAVSAEGLIQGSVSAGFKQPSITSELAINLLHPMAEMDRFTMLARQSREKWQEPFTGNLTATGSIGTRKLLELNGDFGMAKDAINLHQLTLIRPGQKGRITADGSLAFKTMESILSLQIKADGLDLTPELKVPTDLSGILRFAGSLNSYRGDFTFANKAKGWQATTFSASYHGSREGMKVAPFNAKFLDGSLAGTMDMNWSNGFSLQALLSGKGLNPARLDPSWKGVANFNTKASFSKVGTGQLTGNIIGSLQESVLHGQTLTGELLADFKGDNISLARLALQGKGFDLHASGQLEQRITVAANISDFSRLIPGSTGTLRTNGWMSWHDKQLSGAVTGSGSRLSYAGTKISDLNLAARLDQGPGYPVHISAALKNVIYDDYKLNSVALEADGTLTRHTVNATIRSGGSEAGFSLNSGYNSGVWKGDINRLAGKDSSGAWKMTAPAAFLVSAEKFTLSPLALSAGAAERLEASADLTLNPPNGKVQGKFSEVNLLRFKPWFPDNTQLEGRISGKAKGILLSGKQFELDGTARLAAGSIHQKRTDGELNLAFTSATASWVWSGDKLSGDFAMEMTRYGKARGTFQLPLAARFPVAFNPNGPLRGTLIGQVQEKGIITTMFPGLVQESSGVLDADLAVNGTWAVPQVRGKLQLSKAGAFLPTAGIHLKDVQLTAHLEKNLILVDSFKALSGPGHIEGSAQITMDGWRVTNYKGTISGDKFQTVHFPELHILSSPKLSFVGTPQKLTLRGDLQLPELNIIGSQSRTVVTPSSDVIREGVEVPVTKSSPMAMDVQVRVLLGDKVFVKVSGIDAQLGGAIDLSSSRLDRISSKGEIRVIKGHYRTYGVNLEIVRGRLFFAGSTIDRPSIDVLALRTIGNVRAGVTVSGTLQRPITKLYSEPAMPDVDVLAYIVLGHPLGSSGQQASLLTQAAGALLTSGQAAALQEKIKNRLGLSTLEIQGGVGKSNGAMGYKPLQVTAPGAIPADQQAGITETVLTVGKYLTPKLYISYGKSLFSGSNIFRLRYDIFKNWQIETQTGSGESGADIYYKMEFGGGK